MLLTYCTVSRPICSAASSSTLLNHLFGSSPCARGLAAQSRDAIGAAVVGRERKQVAIQLVDAGLVEVLIDQETHVLGARLDVGLDQVDVLESSTLRSLAVVGMTCMTPIAPTGLRMLWSRPDSW